MRISNTSNINLPLAVWLLHDEYDYVDKENYISVTTLMKPLKQIILAARIPPSQRQADVADYIARKYGHAIHDSIERAWSKGHERSLKLLGYPDHVIQKIKVNPTKEDLLKDASIIPVYIEQREFKEINGYTIGGKYDMVADGIPYDHKSTSVWAWIKGTRDEDHRLQISLYKWLNPEKITSDFAKVNYIFTDWSKMMAKSQKDYPTNRVMEKTIDLWQPAQTEVWVANKLRLISQYWHADESEIPECSDTELWRSDPQYKYYIDPANTTGRSTKNFDNKQEADAFAASKGKGVVKTVLGEPKACGYCPAFEVCNQKNRYFTP